jgi:hypothetical protein
MTIAVNAIPIITIALTPVMVATNIPKIVYWQSIMKKVLPIAVIVHLAIKMATNII